MLNNTKGHLAKGERKMAYEQRDNSGVLFATTEKKNDKYPDYTGNMVIGGKPMNIAGWKKVSQAGKPFLSLSFSDPRPVSTPDKPTKKAEKNPVEGDNIPF